MFDTMKERARRFRAPNDQEPSPMQPTPSITTRQQVHRTVLRTPRILLLEPDAAHARQIGDHLTAEDMEVIVADSRVMAASRLRSGQPDVAIVRVELVEGSAYAAVEALRQSGAFGAHTHVIAISERAEPVDRVRALRKGCVDFLALPLHPEELIARVELALSRDSRAEVQRREGIEVRGGLKIDLNGQAVTFQGQPVPLSQKEWAVLLVLAADPERVVPKAELLNKVWDLPAGARTRTMDSAAQRLRAAIRAVGGDYVHSKWGVGYRLTPPNTTD